MTGPEVIQTKLIKEYQALRDEEDPAIRPELEVRVATDQPTWARFYAEHMQNSTQTVTRSVVFLQNLNKEKRYTRRTEVYLGTGDKVVLEKTEIRRIKVGAVNVVLAQERLTDPSPGDNIVHGIRLRQRYSTMWGEWRLDMTIVQNLSSSDMGQVPALSDQFFRPPATDPRTIMDPAYQYEIEAEFRGEDAKALGVFALQQVAKRMENGVRPGRLDADYQNVLREVARMVNPSLGEVTGFRQILNQPKAFNKETYLRQIFPNLSGFLITDKADGERAFLVFHPSRKVWLSLTSHRFTELSPQPPPASSGIVMDCEFVNGHFYAFDLLHHKESLTEQPFAQRCTRLQEVYKELLARPEEAAAQKRKVPLSPRSPRAIPSKTVLPQAVPPKAEESPKAKEIEKTVVPAGPVLGPLANVLSVKTQYSLLDEKKRRNAILGLTNPGSKHLQKLPYEVDGFILTPADDKSGAPSGYFAASVYKYKPPSRQSVDFLVMRAPENLVGTPPYERVPNRDLYFLFCYVGHQEATRRGLQKVPYYGTIFRNYNLAPNIYPIQFAPAGHPYAYLYYHDPQQVTKEGETLAELNGQVAEFNYLCEGEKSAGVIGSQGVAACRWQLARLRPDKMIDVANGTAYGNSLLTAELTFQNYMDPITVEFLLEPVLPLQYFNSSKDDVARAPAKFNAFVKAQVLKQLRGAHTVVDLASGQAQDLFVYAGYGVNTVVLTDRDAAAVDEMHKRATNLGDPSLYVYAPPPARHPTVHILETDLARETWRDRFKALNLGALATPYPGGVSAVVINFALHYFLESTDSRDRFLDQVDSILRRGGLLLITCLDGEAVFRLLRAADFEVVEGQQTKYKLTRLYKQTQFSAAGMPISVKLPFSSEPFQEYLVNIKELTTALRKRGYLPRQNASFGDWLARFERYWPKAAARLTDNDRRYNSLYRYLTFYRT